MLRKLLLSSVAATAMVGSALAADLPSRKAPPPMLPVVPLFTWTGFFLIRIPLAYYFIRPTVDLGRFGEIEGLGLGLLGAWWAMFADLVARGLFFLVRFAWGSWQGQKV